MWVLWVVEETIKFKSGSLNCRNYAFSPLWMVKQNEKHEKKYTCRTVRGVFQFNMFLIKSRHFMWISILHEERHQEILQCYCTLVKFVPISDQGSISLLKNVQCLSPLAAFTMLFLPSIFSFSVTTSQIPSHSHVSVSTSTFIFCVAGMISSSAAIISNGLLHISDSFISFQTPRTSFSLSLRWPA